MAPGPNLGANRFALLDDVPAKKRKNASHKLQPFPSLPALTKANHKFVVVSATDPNKPLSSYSCFAVHRALNIISKDILTISELRDGNLLLLTTGTTSAEKFIAAKELHGICQIKANYHINLNSTKGTVYAPFLNNIPEEEIVSEMREQGVISAYKFLKNIEGKTSPSGVVLLTFDMYHLPSKVEISWRLVPVQEYIPNPMRCKKCQILGHTMKFCNRPTTCVTCNLPPHEPSPCTRTICANCSEEHPASSPSCPRFLQAKELMRIKTVNKCSMHEAIKIQQQQNQIPSLSSSSSFAAIVKQPIEKKTTQHNNNNTTTHQKQNPSSSSKSSSTFVNLSKNQITLNQSNELTANSNKQSKTSISGDFSPSAHNSQNTDAKLITNNLNKFSPKEPSTTANVVETLDHNSNSILQSYLSNNTVSTPLKTSSENITDYDIFDDADSNN